jgi:hypothetical protein
VEKCGEQVHPPHDGLVLQERWGQGSLWLISVIFVQSLWIGKMKQRYGDILLQIWWSKGIRTNKKDYYQARGVV